MRRGVILFVLAGQAVFSPARAGDMALVPGGLDVVQGNQQTQILSSQRLSLGTLSPVAPASGASLAALPPLTNGGAMFDKLALGGYVTYSLDSYSLSSAIRNRDTSTGTDFSALYPSVFWGLHGTTALTLGYDWHHPSALFSPNAQATALDAFGTGNTGVSLSLSWNHAITPSLYLGGFATAEHNPLQMDDLLPQPNTAFKVGAGLGVKF